MATSETLKGLYEDIKEFTAQAGVLYDKKRYVEQHGKLPELKTANTQEMDIYQVKDQIKKLNDLICKTGKKLENGQKSVKPAKAEKIAEWELKLHDAQQQRDKLYQIKSELEDAE